MFWFIVIDFCLDIFISMDASQRIVLMFKKTFTQKHKNYKYQH